MGIAELLGIVLGSDLITGVVTHLLTRRKYKVDTTDTETSVLQREITFLSERLEMLNTQLNSAVEREIQNIKTIAELQQEIANLKNKDIEEQ